MDFGRSNARRTDATGRALLALPLLWLAVTCAPKTTEPLEATSPLAAKPASTSSSPPAASSGVAAPADASAADAAPPDAATPAGASQRPLVLGEVLALRPDERNCVTARESSGNQWTQVAFEDARGALRRIVYLSHDEKKVGWMQVLLYDARGNVVRIDSIDASGKTTDSRDFGFDAEGVLRHFAGSNGLRSSVEYTKEARAGEVFVRAERLPWRWIRDTLFDESPEQLPTTGWVKIVDQPGEIGSVDALHYDEHGRLRQRLLFLGGAVVRGAPPSTDTTFVRDGRGRLLEARIKSNETATRARETYTWKGANLVRISASGPEPMVREMEYDSAGRLTRGRLKSKQSILSETTFVHECPELRE